MLVLTREAGQSIIIGGQIKVTVVEIRGDQIRLGIDAPRKIAVHREEVFEEIKATNRQAAAARPSDIDLARRRRPR